MRTLKMLLTWLPVFVILATILMYKFLKRPLYSIREIKRSWNYVFNGIDDDYTPTHSQKEKTKA